MTLTHSSGNYPPKSCYLPFPPPVLPAHSHIRISPKGSTLFPQRHRLHSHPPLRAAPTITSQHPDQGAPRRAAKGSPAGAAGAGRGPRAAGEGRGGGAGAGPAPGSAAALLPDSPAQQDARAPGRPRRSLFPRQEPAARPGLTRARRRGRGRSPGPGAGGAAPSSSPPSTCGGRAEAAHPPRQRDGGRSAGGGGAAEEKRPLGRPLPPRPRRNATRGGTSAAVTTRRPGPLPPALISSRAELEGYASPCPPLRPAATNNLRSWAWPRLPIPVAGANWLLRSSATANQESGVLFPRPCKDPSEVSA